MSISRLKMYSMFPIMDILYHDIAKLSMFIANASMARSTDPSYLVARV